MSGSGQRWRTVVVTGALAACIERSTTDDPTTASREGAERGSSLETTASASTELAREPADTESPAPARGRESSAPCPSDMLPVAGSYCSKVEQVCARELGSHRGHPTRSERCLEYLAPSVCKGPRSELRFCIDRFEWPNREHEKPLVLVSWQEATRLCESAGKRLCGEEEWTLACEGDEMLPYALGYRRPVAACAIDLPYRQPQRALSTHDECSRDARCTRELERLDQRRPSLAASSCTSPFGAIDMNGNVNEWVNATGGRYPHRGALKGGWWGPVRNRCRPAVLQHRDDHWGYEIGFRCCRNADDTLPVVP